MGKFYPAAKVVAEVTPIDEATVAAKIIDAMETGKPKDVAIGECLAGSNDVAGFERIWRKVKAEQAAAWAVDPTKFAAVTAYKNALQEAAPHIDLQKWADGMRQV